MSSFDREELIDVLSEASSALGRVGLTLQLSYFWFNKDAVYAYDGGLGIRLDYDTGLHCGIPGRALLELLKTTTVKQIDLDASKKDVVIKLGKSEVTIAQMPGEDRVWPFPDKPGKSVVPLNEQVLSALKKASFVRLAKPTQHIHHGIILEPGDKDLQIIATDSKSLVSILVDAVVKVERCLLPWPFVDCVLKLVKPTAKLYILDDCLMVEDEGVQICSNRMELPDAPNVAGSVEAWLKEIKKQSPLPDGLAPVLQRAEILSGTEEAWVKWTTKGEALRLSGTWAMGTVDHRFPLKAAAPEASGEYLAAWVRRGLNGATSFALSDERLMLFSKEEDYVYAVVRHTSEHAKARD